ncbi:hypothetical protein H0O03_04240 [Candidatus Micrarchaeota archaeon]|nr:hypothetical protein [Candidatus Micrarchaeota archaeon]
MKCAALAFLILLCLSLSNATEQTLGYFYEMKMYSGSPSLSYTRQWTPASAILLNSINYSYKIEFNATPACVESDCILQLSNPVVRYYPPEGGEINAYIHGVTAELESTSSSAALNRSLVVDTRKDAFHMQVFLRDSPCGFFTLQFNASVVAAGYHVPITNYYLPVFIPCQADVLMVGNSAAFLENYDVQTSGLDYHSSLIKYINKWGRRGKTVRYVDVSQQFARNFFGISANPDAAEDYSDKSYDELNDDTSFGRRASRRFVPIVRALRQKVNPSYLILMGGNTVLPMPFALDPHSLISRGKLRSDDPYASLDGGTPDIIVTRFPTPEYRFQSLHDNTQNDPRLLIRTIYTAATAGDLVYDGRILVGDACGLPDPNDCFLRNQVERQKTYFGGECGYYTGQEISGCFWVPDACRYSEEDSGSCATELVPELFSSASFYMLTVHGSNVQGEQVAKGPNGDYVIYNAQRDAAWLDFSILNPIVYALSCWSGMPDETRISHSFAMQSLGMGARTFIGQSSSHMATTEQSRAIPQSEVTKLLTKFVNERKRIGEAYLEAKKQGYSALDSIEVSEALDSATIGHPSEITSVYPLDSLDEDEIEAEAGEFYNTWSMVLYGDPYGKLT